MNLVPFYPSTDFDSLKRNAVLLVTLGIVVVFGVVLFTLPLSSMRAVSAAGKKMASLVKATTVFGVQVSTKVTESSIHTVRSISNVAVSGMTGIAEKAVDMIHFITDMLENMYQGFGKIVKLTVNSVSQLTEEVSKASVFMLESISRISRKTVNVVKSGFESVMKVIMKSQEALSDAIEYCFVPAMETFLKTTYGMAEVGVKIYTRYLPMVVKYMYEFFRASLGLTAGATDMQVQLGFVSLFASIFTRVFTETRTRVGSITSAIGAGVTETISGFIESVNNLQGDLCDTVVQLVEDSSLNYFNTLPTGVDLDNACSEEFIKLGLKWMTGGSICGRNYTQTVSNFATCMYHQIANVSFVPSTSNSSSVINFISGSIPSVFDPIIGGLGSFSFSLPSLSLEGLISNLQSVITTLFTQLESWIFSQEVVNKFSPFTMVEIGGAGLPTLAVFIYQLIYKLLIQAAQAYLNLIDSKTTEIENLICERINAMGCVSVLTDTICETLDFWPFTEVCEDIFESFCFSQYVDCGDINTSGVRSFVLNSISGGLSGDVTSIANYFAGLFLGDSSNYGGGSWP